MDLRIPSDSKQLKIGASEDLLIYHDGSNSYIQDTGTGNLLITGSDSIQLKSAGDEFYIFCSADGQVALYNNGVKKFETSGTGVAVEASESAYVTWLCDKRSPKPKAPISIFRILEFLFYID